MINHEMTIGVIFLYALHFVMQVSTANPDTTNGIYCYCNSCPDEENETTESCLLKPGGQCFSAIEPIYNNEKKIWESIRSFGCFSKNDEADSLLQCKGDLVQSYYGRSIKCCNFTDFCNQNLTLNYTLRNIDSTPNNFFKDNLYVVIGFLIAFISGFVILLVYVLSCNKCKKPDISEKYLTKAYNVKLQKSRVLQECISTSGSGIGKPLLIQTTIGRQFRRNTCLGTGRFTEVYLGDWNASRIVEKVFSTRAEDRWAREKHIFETALLRHENVLGYIASDILNSGLRAIYTEYYENGSLQNYLDNVCLSHLEFMKLVRSAANGIAQLHIEVLGTEKRPAVAHRDITSNNFLINSNKECVISNFEIAIMHLSTDDKLDEEPDLTLGTPGYMAPEIVSMMIDISSFEAFKKADIFSLGLVFHDIYQHYLANVKKEFILEDDIMENEQSLHCIKNTKADILYIPPRWENHLITLQPFVAVMRECLYDNPKSRPTALWIKKRTDALLNVDIV